MNDGRRAVRYNPAQACDELSTADPLLGKLIKQVGPFTLRIKSSHSPFEALLESIIYQQLHGKAAASILQRLLAIFGDDHPRPEQLLAASDEVLRAAGVSRSKTLALRDLAAKTLDGTVPSLAQIRRQSDTEIVDRLTEVRGIGPWTVEMLLMFRLGRPDILPVTDFGIRKGFALTFGKLAKKNFAPLDKKFNVTEDMLPSPAQMLKRGERWRPWRSVASWYLWRACDLANLPSPPPA
jgi:DNA-3-methyladenine glycosylase II